MQVVFLKLGKLIDVSSCKGKAIIYIGIFVFVFAERDIFDVLYSHSNMVRFLYRKYCVSTSWYLLVLSIQNIYSYIVFVILGRIYMTTTVPKSTECYRDVNLILYYYSLGT